MYWATGYPIYGPIVLGARLFFVVILQYLYDLSDREVEEQITFNRAFKWFSGLSAGEFSPDHTTLCRFRQRSGDEGAGPFPSNAQLRDR
ncbi:transposase [Desulfobacca acetoxidans]|uniref:transposase n=1 Tax=Desulfobacca acetoxidans TaxID=60893 RepID=UPI00358DE7B0